ncbi:MAG: ABC transporter ATP-binding protein [Halobacteria archaeon]|nr:ABC transporter ATP-binding protein [Halobacteria archaeon]
MPISRLENVVKRYETGGETIEALKGIDFEIERREFVTVMGPSGSGKSTMLNILGLLDGVSEGRVLFKGDDVTDLSDREMTRARRESIGFVFQDFHLIPTLTAKENVEVPANFAGGGKGDRAVELLETVGLGDRTDHYPGELSGGQKQRVALARALINTPELILADEPTGNLDSETGTTILEEISEICDRGVGVVAVTHDELVTEYSDRTLHLVDGEIQGQSEEAEK